MTNQFFLKERDTWWSMPGVSMLLSLMQNTTIPFSALHIYFNAPSERLKCLIEEKILHDVSNSKRLNIYVKYFYTLPKVYNILNRRSYTEYFVYNGKVEQLTALYTRSLAMENCENSTVLAAGHGEEPKSIRNLKSSCTQFLVRGLFVFILYMSLCFFSIICNKFKCLK